jgi:hypothetical protein
MSSVRGIAEDTLFTAYAGVRGKNLNSEPRVDCTFSSLKSCSIFECFSSVYRWKVSDELDGVINIAR